MDVFLTGFSKKPCVAVFIIITVIMCLTMSEAAPQKYNGIRLRHRKYSENELKIAKERRHEHIYNLGNRRQIKVAKNKFIEARHQVGYRLSYLLDKFNKSKNNYLEKLPKKLHLLPVDWFPRVDFVAIRRNSTCMSPKKTFKYLRQRLYKPLMKYKFLFEQLRLVEIKSSSSDINDQIEYRKSFMNETVLEIQMLLTLIDDYVYAFKIKLNKTFKPKDLTGFKRKPDDSSYAEQDLTVLEAYLNFLDHWQLEFTRSRISKPKKHKRCIKYEKKLQNKIKKNIIRTIG